MSIRMRCAHITEIWSTRRKKRCETLRNEHRARKNSWRNYFGGLYMVKNLRSTSIFIRHRRTERPSDPL